MKKRAADILVESLLELGIDDCFCVVGGGAMHLNNAFKINDKMHNYYCHHEQACAFAAEGYAKYSGKIAVVSVTSGPGAVNTLNGVYSAYVDSAPMIVIAGHPRYSTTVEASGLNLRCMGVQEYDIIPTVQGMTKYAKLVKDPLSIKAEVNYAVKMAMDGRRGPVWLSIPLDIQADIVEEQDLYPDIEFVADRPRIEESMLREILNAITTASKPCILAGSGIRTSATYNEFIEFLSHVQVPVIGGALISDILPEKYENYYGLSGNIGPRAGNYILQESDLIVVLGDSMSTRQTGFNIQGFAPNAKIIMVDAEKDEPYKPGLKIDYPLHMALSDFFDAMKPLLKSKEIVTNVKWSNYCRAIYDYFVGYDEPDVPGDGTIPEKLFWKEFLSQLPDDGLVALGNSNGVIGVFQYGIKHMGQRVITNYNAGSMGYDLPEAVGVAVASNKNVICVTGDGSVMMNLQELETIRYNRFPIKLVVFSNHGYGAIRQTCKNYFHGTYTGCDSESGVDFPSFGKVADTFGFEYLYCGNIDELHDSIERFMAMDGRVLLEVEEDINDTVIPKIMSKMREDGTFETPEFTDLSPFLLREEIEAVENIRKEYLA